MKNPMYRMIELHDSRIAGIAEVGSQVVIFFSHAYMHQSEGEPGVDAGTGWSQAAALTFYEASVEGDEPVWPAGIWHGDLFLGTRLLETLIPVPFEHAGDVVLRLRLDSPAEIVIKGTKAVLTLIGDPEYIEEFGALIDQEPADVGQPAER